MSELEIAGISAIFGFATGFLIEYGRADPRDMYRFLFLVLMFFVFIVLVTGNVWEFLVITVPFSLTHWFTRWLFGPIGQR